MAEPSSGRPEDFAPPPVRRNWRPSLVWIVPIVAALVGIGLGVRTWLAAGPVITISFHTAEGLEAGRTEVRYKEVVVGHVIRVALSADRAQVIATVQLDKHAAGIAVEDSRFWVVRPRVGATGVTGLGTLLSGAYIGVDAGESDESRRHFVGLEAPPFFLRGEPGRVFALDARQLGSLDVGSPVYYRRMRVGRVVGFSLDPQRDIVNVQVFVEAPNDRLVTDASRWWNAGGIDLQLDANGLTVNTQSIASVLAGGVAFANPSDEPLGTPATEGRQFRLYRTRKEALAAGDGPPLPLIMVFDQPSHGLAAGAPVELLGIEVGEVRSVTLRHDSRRGTFRAEVRADIQPQRLGPVREEVVGPVPQGVSVDALFIKRLVEAGLRAQVRSGNLVTGQLYIALDLLQGVPARTIDAGAQPLPVPTVPGTLADVQQQLADIVRRLDRVPFDRIGTELEATLKSARASSDRLQRTLAEADGAIRQLAPQAREAIDELRGTLQSAQSALASIERNVTQPESPLQRGATQALAELQRAARALRVLADELQRHPESLLRGKPADRVPELTR
jgi:paraquat-inducible protein B